MTVSLEDRVGNAGPLCLSSITTLIKDLFLLFTIIFFIWFLGQVARSYLLGHPELCFCSITLVTLTDFPHSQEIFKKGFK